MDQNIFFEKKKKELYELIKHCIKSVPYYQKSWGFELPTIEDFDYNFFSKAVPVLEKDIVRNNSELLISNKYNKERLTIDATSGTEGKPIICYRSIEERMTCSKTLWRLRRSFIPDLKPSDKFARFYAFRSSEDKLLTNKVFFKDNDIYLPLFDLSPNRLVEYWNELLKFKPRWMHGPSSTIYSLALAVENNNLERFPLEFVELSGEYVQEEHEKFIQKIFNCKTANQYGSREYWPIAYSHSDGRLQVIENNVFLEEVYSPAHNANEILMTTLVNDSWPLVRYRICDLGDISCENGIIYLDLKRGRKADFFNLRNGKTINAIVFSGIARGLSEIKGNPVIQQFQVVKKDNASLLINLKLNENENNHDVFIDRYRTELLKIIGEDIKIEFNIVDFIAPDNKTGKTKEFINLGD